MKKYYPTLFYPKYAVWELTFACNMKCMHCGSSAGGNIQSRFTELSTREALDLCDQLIALRNRKITLSGGELLLRNDWDKIAKKLIDGGVEVYIITNGFLIKNQINRIKALKGLSAVGISLDGTEKLHNYIRGIPKAYEGAIEAFKLIKESGITTCAITSVSKLNLNEIENIYGVLKKLGVSAWQLQLIIGEGRMRKSKDLPSPEEQAELIKLMAKIRRKEKKMYIYPGDNLGYYCKNEEKIRDFPWYGCMAGILNVGIEANGNIKGCLSIAPDIFENNPFVEGNIRERSLKEIWEDKNKFSYNRNFDGRKIKGFCKRCQHVNKCRCGCTATNVAVSNSRYDNLYCSHKLERCK